MVLEPKGDPEWKCKYCGAVGINLISEEDQEIICECGHSEAYNDD